MRWEAEVAFALRRLRSNKGLLRWNLIPIVFKSLLSITEHLTATSGLSSSLVSKVRPDFKQ